VLPSKIHGDAPVNKVEWDLVYPNDGLSVGLYLLLPFESDMNCWGDEWWKSKWLPPLSLLMGFCRICGGIIWERVDGFHSLSCRRSDVEAARVPFDGFDRFTVFGDLISSPRPSCDEIDDKSSIICNSKIQGVSR
jgi:hypothetical protein